MLAFLRFPALVNAGYLMDFPTWNSVELIELFSANKFTLV